jgi:tetratricopeptide (TPR) repeat protein
MIGRKVLVATAGAVALVAPLALAALGDTPVYYEPPRMVKQGKSTSAIAGDGKVVVQVLVNADGTFKVQKILKSTNHADDAAALEIAKTSTYAAASRGSKKLLAFYDYTLNFKGGGANSADDQTAGDLGRDERELRAGNYSGAQTALKTYVTAHPDDQRAQLDLGIADTYLSDYQDGIGAFDKAGTVPTVDAPIAAKAYTEHAIALLNAKDVAGGLAAAKTAAGLNPSFGSDDTLGVAELENGDAAASVADLEKAHAVAKSDASVPAASRVTNPKASALVGQVMASYYGGKAQDASKAAKLADAAALYLQAADADPAHAGLYFDSAAFAFLKMMPADDKKAKDAADKALAANPNDPSANYAEGIALADQGKKDDATAALAKADSLAKAAGNTDLAAAIEKAQKQLSGGGAQ